RRGVSLFSIVLLVAAFAAAIARADGGTTTTATTTTSTTDTTTTDTTTTSTTTTETTITTTAPTYVPLAPSRLPRGCVGAGVAAITSSGRSTVALKLTHAGLGASEYPASSPFLTFDSAAASGSSCSHGSVALTHVSLFGSAVTAAR